MNLENDLGRKFLPRRSVDSLYAASAITDSHLNQHQQEHKAELDSHTDTCVLGPGCRIIHETLRFVNVTPFTQALGQADCQCRACV
jgi:hypothetical protein